jgi:hypothetical protein
LAREGLAAAREGSGARRDGLSEGRTRPWTCTRKACTIDPTMAPESVFGRHARATRREQPLRSRGWRALAAFSVVTVFAAPDARAQGRDPAAATDLFARGREAIAAGELQRGCAMLADSQRLDPKVGTLLNLADCEEKLGHLGLALAYWRQAEALAQATGDDRAPVARDRAGKLAPRVPRLRLDLGPSAPPGTTVLRDGVELGAGSLGTSLPLDPGTHRVTVRCPGRPDRVVEVTLGEGDNRALVLAPAEAIPGAAPAPPPAPSSRPAPASSASSAPRAPAHPLSRQPREAPDHTLAYVLGGVGAAGMVVATITGAMLLARRSTVREHCDANDRCDDDGLRAADSAKPLVPINTASWIVGVAGLGAGAYLYLSAPPASGEQAGGLGRHAQQGLALRVRGVF